MSYKLSVLVAGILMVCLGTTTGAFAEERSAESRQSAAEALAAELKRDPVGEVVGNTIVRPDGEVFVAVDAEVYSLSQCSSGRFCLWSLTNYTGSFRYKTGSGVTHNLTGTIKSIWNNRTKVARLYSNTGTSSTCYAAGGKNASLSAAYQAASKVYLSSGGC